MQPLEIDFGTDFLFQRFFDVRFERMLDETRQFALDLGHELVVVQVVLETAHFNVGVELAAGLLLLAIGPGDGDLYVDVVDVEVDGTGVHPVAGRFDEQIGGPLQTGQGQVVAHAVRVVGITMERHVFDFWLGLAGVLETDERHSHGQVVLLPLHAVELAAVGHVVVVVVVGRNRFADLGFHLFDHVLVGEFQRRGGHDLFQHPQVPLLQHVVENGGVRAVDGLDGGVGVMVFGGPDHGVLAVERRRHVAGHLVQNDREITRLGAVHVGLERSGGLDPVEVELREHHVPVGADVHVLQVAVVEVLHGRVQERHEFGLRRQFDGVLLDGQRGFQAVVVVFADAVAEGDFVQSGDFLDHFRGKAGRVVHGHLVVVAVTLFAGSGTVAGLFELPVLAETVVVVGGGVVRVQVVVVFVLVVVRSVAGVADVRIAVGVALLVTEPAFV